MRSQIAFVLSFLSPLCQAEFSAICPSAKASLCKGCCAKDHNYDALCAKVPDETACGKQIACHWSDGPVSGAVYSAFDDFLNIDEDFYNCYQSNSLRALTAHMATLKDSPQRAQYHHKRPPVTGACGQCWYTSNHIQYKFGYSKVVAPGVTEFSDRKLNMATSAVEVQAAPTGKYTASVPFILTMTLNFNDDGSMDFDNNVKIAHQEINCPKTKVAITDAAVTFPNIGNTGDCMGDALRGQKKDVTKFKVDINSDATLTFHSDGWPDLKLKKASEVVEVQAKIEDSTCAKKGDCGLAYQACCAGFAAKGFPCGCHLKDGAGASGANCGTCGTAYSVCCAGFAAKGFPCTCDISSDGDSVVV